MRETHFPYKRFAIGDNVKASKVVVVSSNRTGEYNYRENENKWQRQGHVHDRIVIGKIVGIKRLFVGEINRSEWGKNQLKVKDIVIAWKIKQGMMNKPVYILNEDIEPTDEDVAIPTLYTKQPPWTKSQRDFLREEMRDHPRDKNGRWL